MALDVYTWLAQRLHRISSGKPLQITWVLMCEQFGQGFARLRGSRRNFLQTLHQVQAAYPQARIDAAEAGLTLSNRPPPVAPQYSPVLPDRKPTAAPATHGTYSRPRTTRTPWQARL